jgi:hypothetical protein
MSLTCFHCKKNVEIEASSGVAKVGFRDTCTHCSTDLHVCRNCAFYDEGAYHECREPQAEWVKNKEKSNVCEYFKPAAKGGQGDVDAKAKQLAALDDLFKK